MSNEENQSVRERITESLEAWNNWTETGETSELESRLAEEFVLLPPGGSAIQGKSDVLAALNQSSGNVIEQSETIEDIFVDENLAICWVSLETRIESEAGEEKHQSTKGVDIFRRDENGDLKQLLSIWNDGT